MSIVTSLSSTTTALSIIQDAFELLKVYAPGVTIVAADSSRALQRMNDMLDGWSNDEWTCYANLEQSFTLQPGKNSYTIGNLTGADIISTRPLAIAIGEGAAYLLDSNNNRYPVNVIEQDKWNLIGLLTTQSQLPDTLFYDPQFPLAKINVFPTPSSALQVFFDSRLQLVDLNSLSSPFSLPPGYRIAVVNNLAVNLWPYYKQGDPTQILIGLALDSLAKVKRTNTKISPSTYDSAVVSRAQSSYNIYNDNGSRGGPR